MNTTPLALCHPLTAVMARRDNAMTVMTGRHASNLQWRGMGQIRVEGRGAQGWVGEVAEEPQQMRPYEPTTDRGGACRLHR